MLALLLRAEEFEQALDFRRHVPVRLEDLGGVALHVDRAFGGSPALVRKWLAEQFPDNGGGA